MDGSTRARLRALNRRFYARFADAFASSRGHAWPGWTRIPLQAPEGRSASLRVLDVGCGNARYAAALREQLASGFAYLGVDESEAMLVHARDCLAALPDVDGVLECADVLEDDAGEALPDGRFDLVVAFGLLHHVPGQAARRALLEALAGRVGPGGTLAVAAWQFADHDRFVRRAVPWSTCTAPGEQPIDPSALEPGDHLLRFADAPTALRYCHHCDDAELDALVAGLPLEEVARYSADGRSADLNRYVVLRRSAPEQPR